MHSVYKCKFQMKEGKIKKNKKEKGINGVYNS